MNKKTTAYFTTVLYITLIDGQVDSKECELITERFKSFDNSLSEDEIKSLINKYKYLNSSDFEMFYKNSIIYLKNNLTTEEQDLFLDLLKEISRGEYISRTIEDETYEEVKGLLSGQISISKYFSH